MGLAIRQPQTARNRFLLVLPDKLGEIVIGRAATVAQIYDAELHVFCPVVVPPVPVTGVTPEMPSALQDDDEFARSQGRQRASVAVGLLAACDIDVRADTRICPTLTDGIEDAIARVRPNMLLLPKMPQENLLDRPYIPDIERIISGTELTTWLFGADRNVNDAIIGVLTFGSTEGDNNDAAEHVARITTQLASAFDCRAHLLCENKTASHDLAEQYGVAEDRVHVSEGNEDDTVDVLIDPLGISLVVAYSRASSALGGLLKRQSIPALRDRGCDVLILGTTDIPQQHY
jgi:hypothetical protein